MIRVVKQLCINSPSKIEGDKGPPRRRQAFLVPHSTFPAPQALLNTYNLTLICSMPCGILWE